MVNTKNLSARIIHLGMRIFCWLNGIKQPDIIYNHALIYKNGVIYEADFPRVNKMVYDKWSDVEKNKKARIKKLKIDCSLEEEKIILNYLNKQVGKKYELINFWWHLIKIFTGKWHGRKDDKKLYCYELIIYALNTITKEPLYPYLNPVEFSINIPYICKEI